MISSHNRRAAVLVIAVVLLGGCGSYAPQSTPAPITETAAAPLPSAVTARSPSEAPAATAPSEEPIDEVIDGVGELDTLLDVAVVTVTDRLRIRSAPRVSDDSVKYEPLLPLGTSLYAFNGPVNEAGYSWYEVASVSLELNSPGPCGASPEPCGGLYTGWAARQSRDGELWLAPGDADCPPLPVTVRAVLALRLGARLACFSRVPITLQARLIECNCDVDGGGFQPSWFGVDDQPLLLVEPSETWPPQDYEDWLIVALDPLGRYPDVLPIDQIVEITGIFDHPDAQDCTYQGVPIESAGTPMPSSDCRFIFATTSIAVAQS